MYIRKNQSPLLVTVTGQVRSYPSPIIPSGKCISA